MCQSLRTGAGWRDWPGNPVLSAVLVRLEAADRFCYLGHYGPVELVYLRSGKLEKLPCST